MTLVVALALAAVMGAVGRATTRILATGGYRMPEDQPSRPLGTRWWPTVAMGLLAAYAGWRLGELAAWAALPAYLLFAWTSVVLIWIDLDVHRLPFGVVLPATLGTAVLLAVASVAAGGWRWLWALCGALGLWAFFAVLARVPGGVGGGDVMLAPMIGLLLGWLSPVHVLVGLFATFLVGGAQAALLLLTGRVGPKDAVAFGPAMCVGAWIAIGSTSQIVTLVFSV